MNRPMAISAFFVLTLLAGYETASAQPSLGGKIALFTDASYTDSTLVDSAPGTLIVYVVHLGVPSAAACQFSVLSHGGFSGVWLYETSPLPVTLGASPDGIAIDYGGCKTTPILVLVITYQLFGTSAPCSYLALQPHPDSITGRIDVVTCTEPAFAAGGTIITNCTVSATDTTWGKVKSLYR